jgi:hypothetical protein
MKRCTTSPADRRCRAGEVVNVAVAIGLLPWVTAADWTSSLLHPCSQPQIPATSGPLSQNSMMLTIDNSLVVEQVTDPFEEV